MAHKNFEYCVAECWGKGFIKLEDSLRFKISGFPGNVWQIPAHNQDANLWISKVAGTKKTLQEAQAIVTAEVSAAQAAWDALPEDQKNRPGNNSRPTDIVLPE